MLRTIFRNKNKVANVLNQRSQIVGFNKRFAPPPSIRLIITYRFEGSYPWFQSEAEMIPRANPRIADETLDETEVITRILYVLNSFHIYDLQKIQWDVRKKSFIFV